MTGKVLDLTNFKFGKLTAIKPVVTKDCKRKWLCECECGDSLEVETFSLTSGSKKNCGNFKCRSDVSIGDTFGKLEVLDLSRDDKNRRFLAHCSCECGGFRIVPTRYLQRGSRTDCGCGDESRRKQTGMQIRKDEEPQLIHKIMDTYKRNAERRGYSFELKGCEFEALIKGNCHYCNSPPLNEKVLRDFTLYWNGVDRKDNDFGYVSDNVVTCCSDCNYMKNNRNYAEFIEKVKVIYETINGDSRESLRNK